MDRHLSARDAAEQLFLQYKDEVYRHALFTLGNPDDAEDVVSEVFIRVLRSWEQFRQDSNVRTWVWSIVRNYLTDVLRARKRQRQVARLDEALHLAEPFPDTDMAAEWEHVIRELSVAQRQVVHLRLVEDLTVAETAERLGWTQAKVRVVYHRAKQKLRHLLETEMMDIPAHSHRREGHGVQR
jgi:RNA polymerase sigma-70 factor, ECF subfamily